jgi:hypothetical protein
MRPGMLVGSSPENASESWLQIGAGKRLPAWTAGPNSHFLVLILRETFATRKPAILAVARFVPKLTLCNTPCRRRLGRSIETR